jgi:hypothetical protein
MDHEQPAFLAEHPSVSTPARLMLQPLQVIHLYFHLCRGSGQV